MRIAMIGTGYVGLVSGACFADFGTTSPASTRTRRRSRHSIAARSRSTSRGSTSLSRPTSRPSGWTSPRICRSRWRTPTPSSSRSVRRRVAATVTPIFSYVYAAAREIAQSLSGFTVVVTKSTVPVGTGDEVERIIRETNPKADVVVASNPEFLREGAAIRDFKYPDRVVVGTSDERGRKVMGDVYRPLSLNQAPLMFTERRTAEMIKYAANAFLATKITFINEIADLAEKVGANVQEVARGIGLDNRIGTKFLHAARASAARASRRTPRR